ncbi:MAG: YjcZ family sporulation protein [Lysinibacillus sp.]
MGYSGNACNTNSYCGGQYYGNNNGSSFAILVVLFILLIIVGTAFTRRGDC